uniref:Uncharacterized protein n=1 Tax=Magallana gigas TaxID=29159 RepID=K1PGT8_MAGGI
MDAAVSHGSDEKQAWVDWMLQALQPLTRHLWRDFTKEAFALVNKYQVRAESEQQQHVESQPLQQSLRPATLQVVLARPGSMPTQWPQDLTQMQTQSQMYHQMYPVNWPGTSRRHAPQTPTGVSTSQQQSQSSDVLAAAARALNE